MKLGFLATALLPLMAATVPVHAQAPTMDYPTGADWSTVTRPANSIVVGVTHTDFDEYNVPLSPSSGLTYAKTVSAKGPVDYLGYSGPPTTSTLANHEKISAQLQAEGYKPLWSCVREQCGGYGFATALSQPMVDAMHGADYHNLAVDTFGPITGDVRYTAFQKGDEYLVMMATLNPGKYSGVLLVNVNGKNPVPQATPKSNVKPQATNTDNGSGNAAGNAVKSQVKSRLGSFLNR